MLLFVVSAFNLIDLCDSGCLVMMTYEQCYSEYVVGRARDGGALRRLLLVVVAGVP